MYDILQLNDMLVPELLDIAEQLKIPNAKKLDKQALISKILDSQALQASAVKSPAGDDKGRSDRGWQNVRHFGRWSGGLHGGANAS